VVVRALVAEQDSAQRSDADPQRELLAGHESTLISVLEPCCGCNGSHPPHARASVVPRLHLASPCGVLGMRIAAKTSFRRPP
jgi:hypothetical protein